MSYQPQTAQQALNYYGFDHLFKVPQTDRRITKPATPTNPTNYGVGQKLAPKRETSYVIVNNTTKTTEKVGAQVLTYLSASDAQKAAEKLALTAPEQDFLVMESIMKIRASKPSVSATVI